jgi:hypothetical protein
MSTRPTARCRLSGWYASRADLSASGHQLWSGDNADQLAALVTTLAVINAYNRFNVMLKNQGGDYEPGQWA